MVETIIRVYNISKLEKLLNDEEIELFEEKLEEIADYYQIKKINGEKILINAYTYDIKTTLDIPGDIDIIEIIEKIFDKKNEDEDEESYKKRGMYDQILDKLMECKIE